MDNGRKRELLEQLVDGLCAERGYEPLEAEKADLEAKLAGGALSMEELQQASARYGALQEELDAAEMRWLELTDI